MDLRAQNQPLPVVQPLKLPQPLGKPGTHAPFVLAFNSEHLARQLTIIEKDALEEIDWKELIELKWQPTPPKVRCWVDYMRTPNQSGVDIVIARFNLVVKWAVSEILLTTDLHERARTITKFIHVAAQARRMRNYATTYQLTVALLSNAVTRLNQTWSLVSPTDRAVLAALESIVQPLRNFHKLRTEMEAAVLDKGCIPFIGIYTHDLAYNAQKPAFVDPDPGTAGTEQLVNFERFQTAAGVVKGLLRLLEASARYEIRPHRELIGRCLWLAALDDSEIGERSKALEPNAWGMPPT